MYIFNTFSALHNANFPLVMEFPFQITKPKLYLRMSPKLLMKLLLTTNKNINETNISRQAFYQTIRKKNSIKIIHILNAIFNFRDILRMNIHIFYQIATFRQQSVLYDPLNPQFRTEKSFFPLYSSRDLLKCLAA